jgi:hypothetical protein
MTSDDQVHALDSAVENAAPLDQPLTGWRLADSRVLHAHGSRVVGTVLSDLGFTDLTIFEEVARRYVRGTYPVLARVDIPVGVRVLPLFKVIGSDEGDILLARGTQFLVTEWLAPEASSDPPRITLQVVP